MKRVGIVGCGNIAQVHAEVLCREKDIELIAFADSQLEKAKEYTEKYGMKGSGYYDSLEEMICKSKLDVVHICTPHYLHVPMAEYALTRGVHVFMEKPQAIVGEELASLINTQQKSAKRVGICFQNRYNKTTLLTQRLLADKRIGDVIGARCQIIAPKII